MSSEVAVPLGAVLGALLLIAAVILALPPPRGAAAPRVRGLSGAEVSAAQTTSAGRWRRLLWLAPLVIVTIGGFAWGMRTGVFVTTAVVVSGTIGLLLSRHRRRRSGWALRSDVAQACAVLAAQVRVGQVPTEALRSAARDCPVLQPALATADLGGDVVACWRQQSLEPGASGLADLARGWAVAASTGAPLSMVLDEVAEMLDSDQSLELVISSEAAAPRATGKVMAALPLVGIALGYLMGGDPVRFLLTSPFGWGCLLAGSVCACTGVIWMERIADHSSAGP